MSYPTEHQTSPGGRANPKAITRLHLLQAEHIAKKETGEKFPEKKCGKLKEGVRTHKVLHNSIVQFVVVLQVHSLTDVHQYLISCSLHRTVKYIDFFV